MAMTASSPGAYALPRPLDYCDGRLSPSVLDPARLPDHIDALYRAACALSGSRHDAEDLVQETLARVLKRPRFVRRDHELGICCAHSETRTRPGTALRPGGPPPSR
jgi:hypothetical protein